MTNMNIYDLLTESDRSNLENIFFVSTMNSLYSQNEGIIFLWHFLINCYFVDVHCLYFISDNSLNFNCQFIRKKTLVRDVVEFEPVEFIGRISKSIFFIKMLKQKFHRMKKYAKVYN